MTVLAGWQAIVVPQRDPEAGCIPAGIEWLLRYHGVPKVDLATFQDVFNLWRRGIGNNDFGTIHRAVQSAYPHVQLQHMDKYPPGCGAQKLADVEQQIVAQKACLLSVTLTDRGRWHICPVVEIDAHRVTMVWCAHSQTGNCLAVCPRVELIRRHDHWPGGNDFLYLV